LDIRGKSALVTGSSKRLGRAIALELGRRGARVAIHHRSFSSEADAAETLRLVRQAGGDGDVFRAELRDLAEVEVMFAAIQDRLGGLDVLINSASVFSPGTADETTELHWDEQMDSNAKAPFFVAQRAARIMTEGKIINLADVAGEVVWPGYLPYSISKAALLAINRGLAKAYAPHIQVNAIAPGPVLFPPYYTDEQKRSAVERTLLKREGSPSDIVSAVVFLVENDYITGEVIHVDGGRHLM
jgi:NAD(P)-dependent dehydrogenase (short-subunit alcohol dehydrogenase family)